jgi:hypothetical protein
VTLFHRPKKSGVPRGLRRAGEAIQLTQENPTMMLHEAVEVIAQRQGFDRQQTTALLRIAGERREKERESKSRFFN